ncbi:GMC family oxidoreductase [Pseudaquabacterium rugosum]|uniref:GMC family oxidoreductase N-terminal domain-containing protein n=1 Tax=Pseudaquabacterium rugosum TaxID=2984194 RepID=A0ABU9BBR6_9BURK
MQDQDRAAADAGTFDAIVVGAGSGGCVVTRRLVQAGWRVLLLEAGPSDDHLFVRMPATFVRVIGTERTWLYESRPQAAAGGRTMHVPQGRTLGGSSSVNAMVYIRGQAQDYDDWAADGLQGWAWRDVLPWFRHAESNQRLSGEHHGTEGPLVVSDTRFRHPLSLAFVKAAQECGLPWNHDFNGARQDGVGFYQTTTREGERASTAATYLAAVRRHPGLTVVTRAQVHRVVIEGGRATGVVWHDGAGLHRANATREVVLSAGALSTPKLLMLSGVGSAAHLQGFGIPVRQDLPGVGENFQDHLEVGVYGRCREPISLLGQDQGWTALQHGLQWQLFRTGLLTSNVVESGGFVDTAGHGRPDVQFHVLPTLVGDVGRDPLPGHGLSLNPCFLRPQSRGVVRLAGTDPQQQADFDGRFLSAEADVQTLMRGVRLARRILRAPSLARLLSEELAPGAAADLSDAAIEAHVRSHAKTVYHPAGTCRMGIDGDPLAVLTPELQVRGIAGLRVADASAFPRLVSGNTNAPVVMLAERCAAFALGHGLAAPTPAESAHLSEPGACAPTVHRSTAPATPHHEPA